MHMLQHEQACMAPASSATVTVTEALDSVPQSRYADLIAGVLVGAGAAQTMEHVISCIPIPG